MGDTPREIRRQHAIRNQVGDGADGGRRRLVAWGMGLAVFTAVLSAVVFDDLFVPPIHTLDLDSRNAVVLGVFLVTGVLASRLRKAAHAAARLADEQAALRRAATLIAQAAPADQVFAAVAEEVGRLAYARTAQIFRYKPDGSIVRLAAWGQRRREPQDLDAVPTGGHNVPTMVLHSRKPARIDNTAAGPGGPSAARPSSGFEIRVDAIACAPRGCEPGQVLSRATQDSAWAAL